MKTLRLPLLAGLFCALNLGNVFAAPTITATQDDGTPAATRKLVGDTVTYTTTISNTAAVIVGSTANDASGVQLTNPTPTNTTEVAGVTISPIAFDDVYPQTVLPNIAINSANIPYNVFGNDYPGTPAVTTIASFDSTSAHGGSVSMTTSGASVGQFTYNPPPGYTGTDTFTYTLTNSVGSSVGTVTITIATSPVIWFVNPAVASTGNGTLSSPFKTVAEAVTAIGTNTGQRIFLYSGAQTTGITLKANGWLVGQAATGTNFDTVMGISPPTGTIARPTLNSTKPTLSNASGSVVTLADNNIVVGVAITGGATGAAVVSSGTVNIGLIGNATTSDVTISGASGGAFSLGAGNGNFSVNAPITSVTGRSVAVTGRTGGIVAFPLAISDTGTGISLTTNTGATVNFTGGLSLSTGANIAFNATGGGTVNATQNNSTIVNTLTTTTGTALNVANTTIGASGLTFRSISSNGAAKGIVLNNTGATAGLTVSGNGGLCDSAHIGVSDCTGGTIQSASSRGIEFTNAVGITLKNMYLKNDGTTAVAQSGTTCNPDVGAGDNTACNAALYFNGATTVSLDRMFLDGGSGTSKDNGINAFGVNGLTLSNSEVRNFWANQKDAANIQNPSGTWNIGNTFASPMPVTFDNNRLSHNWFITSNSGTSNITFTNTTIANSPLSGTGNASGVSALARGGSTVNITADHCNIHDIVSNAVNWATAGGGHMTAVLSNGTATQVDTVQFTTDGNNSVMNYTITGMTITTQATTGHSAIVVGRGDVAPNGVNVQETGTVTNNNVTVNSSTCSTCVGISLNSYGASGLSTTTVTGNTISGNVFNGINLNAGAGNNSYNLTLQNNTMSTTQTPANTGYAMDLISGLTGGDANCVFMNLGDMSAGHTLPANRNNLNGNWTNGSPNKISAAIFFNAQFKLLNYGGATDAAAVAYIGASNNGGADAFHGGTNNFTGGPVCPLLFAPGGVTVIRPSPGSETMLLSQAELGATVVTARRQWEATGLAKEQVAILRNLSFETVELPDRYLAEANGNHISVSKNAGGRGWFIGFDDAQFAAKVSGHRRYTEPSSAPAGHIDLLTAIMHEMGHALGLEDSYHEKDRDNLMYGFLTTGERRSPAKGQAAGIIPNEKSVTHFLTGAVNIGTLPPNKAVKIVYSVTVGPITGNPQNISSQATVSGSNFSSVLATDAVAGSGPTITLLGIAPAFTSANAITFTTGTLGSFNVTANGAPAPTFTFTGTLPSGVGLSSAGVLSGTPAAGTGGTYPITITASNGIAPAAMQSFTLTVNQPPAITTANNTTFTVGTNGNFQLTASGFPTTYTFTNTGNALPSGVTLSASGLLSGTPGAGTGGVYNLTFTVSNGIAPNGTQSFTLTVNQAPAITSVNTTTFTSGTAGSFNVIATGYPAPAINLTGGTLPTGVNFGTGTLAGTPAANAFGTYPLTFTASNGVGSNAVQSFTLVVNPSAQDVKSKPSITGNLSSGLVVSFIGNPGTQYTIQFAPSIPALPALPNWQTLSVQTANASGVFSAPDNPPAGTTMRFYRAITP